MRSNPLFLLADDDIDDQEFFLEALREIDQNINCVVANDGLQALEMITKDATFVPDFIFLDQNMPRMSGLQCLRELRKIDRLADAKIVMYSTSVHVQKDYEEAQSLGVHKFFKKTPSFRELVITLGELLGRDVTQTP